MADYSNAAPTKDVHFHGIFVTGSRAAMSALGIEVREAEVRPHRRSPLWQAEWSGLQVKVFTVRKSYVRIHASPRQLADVAEKHGYSVFITKVMEPVELQDCDD